MKKIKYFFLLLFLFIFIFSLTVNAEETEENIICDSVFDVGDTIIYKVSNNYNGYRQDGYAECLATSSNKYICFYLESGVNSPTGYQLAIFNNTHFTDLSMTITYVYDNGSTQYSPNNYILNMRPYDYHIYGEPKSGNYFYTNIPIFQSKAEAQEYVNGARDINTAINYKKTMENGSWVKPFEDIDINDREIPVPELCNITHSSFSVSNNVDEKYLVEVYLDSGLQNPYYALDATTYNSIDDPFYVNSFGLITDRSEAYWNGPDFDVFALWQVDNRSALLESVNSFYTRFPTAMSWYTAEDVQTTGVYSNFDKTAYGIWGAPFGDKYGLWGNISKVTAEDLAAVDIDDVPLCFTHYRVRYWYYDDDSGYHYGPWASVVYFSDGKVVINSIFQDDDGNIIESGTESGRQDENGILNITDKFGSLDLGSSDNLFAYINSLFTNLNYVAGNFSIVFASVFSFLPGDVRHMIYLGMGAIIVIAIIKALRG